jgi:hypothetical protein
MSHMNAVHVPPASVANRAAAALVVVFVAIVGWFTVLVGFERQRIEHVLERQPAVRELVEHGWVRLFSLNPHGAAVARWRPGLGWEPFCGEEDQESRDKAREAGWRRPVDVSQQSRPRPSSAGQGS